MGWWTKAFIIMLATLLAAQLTTGTVAAQEKDPAGRLLQAAEGLQMPGSEADSFWWFVSYPEKMGYPPPSAWPPWKAAPNFPRVK